MAAAEVKWPVYIEMKHLAKLAGWTTRRVRETLQKADAVFKLAGSGRWVTTVERLTPNFPELARRIAAERSAQETAQEA